MASKSTYPKPNNHRQDITVISLRFLLIPIICLSYGCLGRTNHAIVTTGWATDSVAIYSTNTQDRITKHVPQRTVWKLAGAPNETLGESFLVRLDAPATVYAGFDISDLVGSKTSIDAAHIHIYSVESVSVRNWPGWHIRSISPSQREPVIPDVLVPVEAPGADLANGLEPNVDHFFWVDITIPRDIAPDDYFGEIKLIDGHNTLSTIAIDLRVWPFLLPLPGPTTFIIDVDHKSLISHHLLRQGRPLQQYMDDWSGTADADIIDRLVQQTMMTLRNHGLNLIMSDFSPPVKITSGNEVLPDWHHYRSLVAPALNGALFGDKGGLTRWPMPTKPLMAFRSDAGVSSPLHETLARQYLQQCAMEFDRMGMLSRSYLLVEHHVPAGIFDIPALPYAHWTSVADPRLQVIHYGIPQNLQPFGWVDYQPASNMYEADGWLIPGQFFDPATTAHLRKKGKMTWLQLDKPPFSGSLDIAAPPTYARVIPWLAFSLEADTVFLGQACHWPSADRDASPQACIDFDASTLLYPGRPFGVDHPLASLRLKYLRRGIQDIAYVELLRQHNLTHIERAVRQAIVARAGTQAYRTHFADGAAIAWPTNWHYFNAARDIFAEELSRNTTNVRTTTQSTELHRNVRWRELMKNTRRLDVQCDGTRIRLMGDTLSPTLEIQSSISISNLSRTTTQGLLHYDGVPPSWVPEQASFPVHSILPAHSGRIQMSSTCPLSNMSITGDQRFHISLTTQDGQSITTQARARLVAASRISQPLVIDGELDDWQDSAMNVLRDFELISPTKPSDTFSDRPTSRTLAFVKRDESYLYVAVRCDLEDGLSHRGARRNRIDYDDMIPTGSELIEILIDPLNAGTRSPTDLFHIVVMYNGSDYAEKGIRFNPPCGRSEPWAVNIRIATSSSHDHWTAEIAIPLSAFGSVATDHTIWGFNVTRFDQAHQEFSTWSGAKLNAYDPLSLGNLLLP